MLKSNDPQNMTDWLLRRERGEDVSGAPAGELAPYDEIGAMLSRGVHPPAGWRDRVLDPASVETLVYTDYQSLGLLRPMHRWNCARCSIHGPWLHDEAGREQTERAVQDHRSLHEEFDRSAAGESFWDWVVRVSKESGHALLTIAIRAVAGPRYP